MQVSGLRKSRIGQKPQGMVPGEEVCKCTWCADAATAMTETECSDRTTAELLMGVALGQQQGWIRNWRSERILLRR